MPVYCHMYVCMSLSTTMGHTFYNPGIGLNMYLLGYYFNYFGRGQKDRDTVFDLPYTLQ